MSYRYTMTWGETFAAIRSGDVGFIVGFCAECAIMSSPFILVGCAIYFG